MHERDIKNVTQKVAFEWSPQHLQLFLGRSSSSVKLMLVPRKKEPPLRVENEDFSSEVF